MIDGAAVKVTAPEIVCAPDSVPESVAPLIVGVVSVLLVSTSVVALPTKVSVASGKVNVLAVVKADANTPVIAVVFPETVIFNFLVVSVLSVSVGAAIVGVVTVGEVERTMLAVPVKALAPITLAAHEAAVVPLVRIHVTRTVTPPGTDMTRLAPDELTVTAPVESFSITKYLPRVSVEVTGSVTVWVVEPVNT
jgi:hypothetical protein